MDMVGSEVGDVEADGSDPILAGAGTGRPALLEPDRSINQSIMAMAVTAKTPTIVTIAVRFLLKFGERSLTFPVSGFTSGLLLIF
jgi:hypothetical protein